MKKRFWIPLSVGVTAAMLGILLLLCRGTVTKGDFRDFAAERFGGNGDTRYMQLGVYPTADDHLTPDSAMGVKNSLSNALLTESIRAEEQMRLCAFTEENVTVLHGTRSTDAVATVYFGDYFALHPDIPLTGGYIDEGGSSTEYCVIDDLAAWRLFGSTEVCGMDVQIGGKYYTVCAVLAAERGKYASLYGEFPRIYVRYNSGAFRNRELCFTALEVLLPDPVENFASGIFTEAAEHYGSIYTITGRFGAAALWKTCKSLASRSVMTGERFPFDEDIARVRETKCAYLFFFAVCLFAVAALCLLILLILVWHTVGKALDAWRKKRRTHAIPRENPTND